MVRYAFTMIELIFALVIMGVVFITLPLILINNSTDLERNLMQEAIFASSTKLGQILTFPWDENSLDPLVTLTAANVVETIGADADLDRNLTTDFRLGHVTQPLHRRLTPNSAIRSASVIGAAPDNIIDIADYDGNVNIDLIADTSFGGYKKAYRTTTTVNYLNDTATYTNTSINFTFDTAAVVAGPTNIKMIILSTDQNNSDGWSALPILELRSFSANIGEPDFYKRTY